MQAHTERFSANVRFIMVISVNLQTCPFEVHTRSQEYTAKTLIITTGSSPGTLGVPGETRFRGNGVSYCATCDGYSCKDKRVVVVGGGNSAIRDSLNSTSWGTLSQTSDNEPACRVCSLPVRYRMPSFARSLRPPEQDRQRRSRQYDSWTSKSVNSRPGSC